MLTNQIYKWTENLYYEILEPKFYDNKKVTKLEAKQAEKNNRGEP